MNQLQEGLFAVEEQMPCSPHAIRFQSYILPSTFYRAEQEEAAARILSFSQQLGQWVGVSLPRLVEMMREDQMALYEKQKVIYEVRWHNLKEQMRVQRETPKYHILCVLTLGIYALFVMRPTAQMREMPENNVPFSGIYAFGSQHVITGIHELLQNGMLRMQVTEEGEGQSAFDVFFPTPKLVSRIMQKQGIATN